MVQNFSCDMRGVETLEGGAQTEALSTLIRIFCTTNISLYIWAAHPHVSSVCPHSNRDFFFKNIFSKVKITVYVYPCGHMCADLDSVDVT